MTASTLTKIDRAALQRCIDLVLADASDPGRAEQIRDMLADRTRPWLETARLACSVLQTRALGLKPWESPPCCSNGEGDEPEHKLARKLIDAGLSTYEPDPLRALREVAK